MAAHYSLELDLTFSNFPGLKIRDIIQSQNSTKMGDSQPKTHNRIKTTLELIESNEWL